MFLNTVHHVAIIVSDYELSRDFYVNKLGFEIIRENHRPEDAPGRRTVDTCGFFQ